ncbi:MAG: hypothetical protein AAFP10_06430 [Pseudomonadota bacterium]
MPLTLAGLTLFSTVVSANLTEPDKLLKHDTLANQTHFDANLRSLERQLLGTQLANKDRLYQQLSQANSTPESIPDATGFVTDTGESTNQSHSLAHDLGFSWADPATWGDTDWKTFAADQHQGADAVRLTPLSRYRFDLDLTAGIQLAAQPDGWSVCRILSPEQDT